MAFENNQTKSGRGGKRVGAGRKTGSATKKTRKIADSAAAEGITPLEYMLQTMRNEWADPKDRMQAAISAAPYLHPRLTSVAHSGPNGGPIQHAISRIELVALK